MALGLQPPIWFENHPDQQDPILLIPDQKLFNLITKNTPELCKTVILSRLWTYLIGLSVIDGEIRDELQAKKTNWHQVEELLLYLKRSPCWRFHALCRALCLDDQRHIVTEILGLNLDIYLDYYDIEEMVTKKNVMATNWKRDDLASPVLGLIWTPENNNELKIVEKCEISRKLLTKNYAELTQVVQVEKLWIHLRSMDVFDQDTQAVLAQGANHEQTAKLIDWLLKKPTWRMNAFFRALCLTDQDHIVSEILKLNPRDYREEPSLHVDSIELKVLSTKSDQISEPLREAIGHHSDYYARSMMTGYLFDLKDLGKPYDIKKCFITVMPSEDGYLRDSEDVPPEKILIVDSGSGSLKTALLSGSSGIGKSTTAKNHVFKWSKQSEKERDWDIVVFMNIPTLNLTSQLSHEDNVKEAIEQSLTAKGKEDIMKNISNDKLRVLVIGDALDECRNDEVLDMMKYMVEQTHKGQTNFSLLLTCRSGLCPIRDSLFDQRLKMNGFTVTEGIQYMQNFFEKVCAPKDQSILDFIKNNKDDLKHILTNPMFTHVFSVVTANGSLQLTKGYKLGIKDILEALVKSMTKRQIEKNQITVSQEAKHLDVKDQLTKFYNMCLFALLKGIGKIDQCLLDKFAIDEGNPLFAFLEKRQSFNDNFETVSHWFFTHEVFFEYFSTCALETIPDEVLDLFVLALTQQHKFRNLQTILFSSLGKEAGQWRKLSKIMRATLLLQSKLKKETSSKTQQLEISIIDSITSLKERAKRYVDHTHPFEIISSRMEDGANALPVFTEELKNIWKDIEHFYDRNPSVNNATGLFYFLSKDTELLKHAYACLQQLPDAIQDELFATSIGCLLPSICKGTDGSCHTQYATGGRRWAVVHEDTEGIHIQSSCLNDTCEAVYKHYTVLISDELPKETDHLLGAPHNLDHEAADSSTKRKQVKALVLQFPPAMRHLWAPPRHFTSWKWEPLYAFLSLESWSKVLEGLSQWNVLAGSLHIQWDKTASISTNGLLQCLVLNNSQNSTKKFLKEKEDGCRDVRIDYGDVNAVDLLNWVQRYKQQHLHRVELKNFTCKLPDSLLKESIEKLIEVVHHGRHIFTGLRSVDPEGSVTLHRTPTNDMSPTSVPYDRVHTKTDSKAETKQCRSPTPSQRLRTKHPSAIKIVFVGDGAVGKTCLLISYTTSCFPEEYIPTVFDNYSTSIKVGDQLCNLGLWDTAGQEDYDRLRPMSYPGADLLILCYKIDSPGSFSNIIYKWSPEIRHFCRGTPVVLVACKKDLRNNKEEQARLAKIGLTMVTVKEGRQVADQIGAKGFFECSALTGEGIQEMFGAIVEMFVIHTETTTNECWRRPVNCCQIL